MTNNDRTLATTQILVMLVLATVLVIHALAYYPYMPDDAFISFQYANRWATGFGLTWTDGAPVEGFSNLLWVLLLGCLSYFGLDIIEGARLLGIMCTIGTLCALLNVSHSRQSSSSFITFYANTISGLI